MLQSLKFKITFTALIIVSVIMFVSTWRSIKSSERILIETHKEKTILISEGISHGMMTLMLGNRWQDLQVTLEKIVKGSRDLKKIRIVSPESGRIVASSNRNEIGQVYNNFTPGKIKKISTNPSLIVKHGILYVSKLSYIHNQPACYRCHGSTKKILGLMEVEILVEDIQKSISKLKKEYLIDTMIGFLFVTGTFLFIIGVWIERPIDKMINTLKEIEKGNTAVRMDETSNNELGLLAKSFNSMFDSLEKAKKEIDTYHNEQIQRAARLASLGEIISGIVHEIKNPLTGISCAVQVLHAELDNDDPNKAITFEILNQIRRLDRTIKNLLNYSRPKPLHFEYHSVKDVLDKAVFFIYPEANKQHVKIQIYSEDTIPMVKIDPDQIQQVFLNLMINAVQAMPSGGVLKIRIFKAEKKDVEIYKDNIASENLVCISFSDTGEGISKDEINRIFDPFFTKKTYGTGLGLVISQRIVHEHGGEITVTSTPGKGSEFSVYLPVPPQSPEYRTQITDRNCKEVKKKVEK